MAVGANSVRPPLFAYMVCTNSPPATPRNGTSYFCKAEIAPLPYNSEIITNSEHGRTLFAPTDIRDSLFLRKIAPLFAYLHCA